MLTAAKLKTRTVKQLALMAKRKGIAGWHSMRKQQLVQALARLAQGHRAGPESKPSRGNGSHATEDRGARAGKGSGGEGQVNRANKVRSARTEQRLSEIKNKLLEAKDLAWRSGNRNGATDRLVAMVRDPYWLQAYWELSRQSVDRARAALGQHWYGARPVLRLVEVTRDGTTSSARKVVRDIEVHGGVNNWYIDVEDPPKSYQMEIGYLASGGRFICLARSNIVSTPAVGSLKPFDGQWTQSNDDFDRVYSLSGGYSEQGDHSELRALYEERLGRTVSSPFSLPSGQMEFGKRDFNLEIDAELVVFGVTNPDARVTLKGEPVPLEPDGTFQVRFSLPDRRQVFPVVASSSDGVEQRTIVLAVERNTKVMEPVIREPEV